MMMSKRIISSEELRKLTGKNNAAIAYRGKVYDVSGFLQKHPGGSDQLLLAAGRDATHFFNSYHSKETRKLIAQRCKCIGELEGSESVPSFPEKDELYEVLEDQIHKYFKSNRINPKLHIPFFCAAVTIVLTSLLLWYAAIVCICQGYPLLVGSCFASVNGFFLALVTLNLGHDISHFSWTHKPTFWKWAGNLFSCVHGLSSHVWAVQHVIGHHVHPNHDELDPDVATKKNDFWRIKPFQEWCSYYIYQHIYMPLLFTLLTIKMKIQDFHSMFILKKASVPINPVSRQELLVGFLLPKAVHIFYRLVLPSFYVPFSSLLVLNLLSEMVMGFWLGVITQVNHVNTAVVFPNPNSPNSKMSWSEMQIATTVDYATDSLLWGILSGGLNNQVAHHLFPGIVSFYYKDLTPIVRKTCKEFGVQYNSCHSPWEIWCSHTNHLKNMGQSKAVKYQG